MDVVKLYIDTVIKPLEEKRNELRKIAYSAKRENKENIKLLEECEKVLYKRYMELGKIVFDEYNSRDRGNTSK